MQQTTSISFATLLLLCCFISCKQQPADIYNDIDRPPVPGKIFQTRLPLYTSGTEKGKVHWIYAYIKKQAADAGLDSLESGFKDLQIRVWLHDWLAVKKNLVILSRTNRKWSGELITMTYEYNVHQQEHRIVAKTSRQIIPKSGWNFLFKQLVEQKIFSIDDMEALPGYLPGDDGVDYVFEIATKDQYRMFHYWSPALFMQQYRQAANVVNMVSLLQKEFATDIAN